MLPIVPSVHWMTSGVGLSEGIALMVGNVLGMEDGTLEGVLVGVRDGEPDGVAVGIDDGCTLGKSDGI